MTALFGLAVVSLLLHPVMDEPGTLRLVADTPDVTWHLDGEAVGDGAVVHVSVAAGQHTVVATGPDAIPWTALARADSLAAGSGGPPGLVAMPAWSHTHHPPVDRFDPVPWLLASLAAVVLVARRPKRP